MTDAFDAYDLAGTKLANRIVMAPMTRSRAHGPGNSPTDLNATYYAQRATAGLIVSEGIQPSVVGQGYTDTPGLHSQEQVTAWRTVTGAVHAEGGVIFAQLMHSGRIGHPSLLPDDLIPVAPSAVRAAGQLHTHDGMQDLVTPHELTEAEIAGTIADFVSAARNAIAAGFDGVEIHGANGYLVHQFLSDNANQRTDGWGGTTEGRIRFAVEVATAIAEAIGADKLGIRLSPNNPYNDITETSTGEIYPALVGQLAPLGLAYLHLVESGDRELTQRLRAQWPGTFILNPATLPRYTGPEDLALIEDGTTDLLSYGGLFIANPDLPARLAAGGPYNTPDYSKAFGGDHTGYIDYPALSA
ncbi:alkene reductase [Actinoplanes lobatus]|uniref:Alkene reductase n=1 Tax=Actinoplanes lobatus TaxID=113568 RepID=A0A7W7MJJ5_9ACTN|nr:alkene reductase [Actinoplanes lobatus]MBB4752717.1 N-ethylmaleimide reductase [Actinoplanes lobatus]GGN90679.1 alkene reductase [Actinoplanes lobatus]GIE43946.1 alkene reductase [Actinoplanes lobatus]